MNTHSIFYDWSSEIYNDRNNLVFEGKNKAYGAYQIRREYGNSVIVSFLLACTSILALVGVPLVIHYFISQFSEPVLPILDGPTQLSDEIFIIPEKAEVLKPVEPKQEIVQTSTVQDVVPVVVDNLKTDDNTYRDNSKLEDKSGGTTTADGTGTSSVIGDTHGQTGGDETILETDKKEEALFFAEKMPSFVGGDEALIQYMRDNVHYPSLERELGQSGTVYVYFIINKHGKVEDAKVIRGVKGAKGLDEEALRVIRAMPDWEPGTHGGKAVKVQFTYPVAFRLK